jgi:two-component system sensor histidine kinase YesM
MITVGRKIWNYSGTETGVILLDIYPNQLVKLGKEFLELGTENSIHLFITDSEGRIIYDSDAVTGKNTWDFGKKIDIQNEMKTESNLLALRASSSTGQLLVSIEIPLNKLLSRISTTRLFIIILDALFVLAITVFAARRSLKIDLPIRKLQQNMLQARLHALQGQINPHMLYNTLESIRMKALVNNQDEVAEMIKVLARMFKHSLRSDDHENLILDEFRYAEDYLYIQNVRYDNKFILEGHLSPAVLQTPIIPMVFQPLIENSINHGFRGQSSLLHILIEENFISAFNVKISVTDDGSGASAERIKEINTGKIGIGLKNLSERLRLQYGEDSGLIISSQEGQWFKVEFIIPLSKSTLNNGIDNV